MRIQFVQNLHKLPMMAKPILAGGKISACSKTDKLQMKVIQHGRR